MGVLTDIATANASGSELGMAPPISMQETASVTTRYE